MTLPSACVCGGTDDTPTSAASTARPLALSDRWYTPGPLEDVAVSLLLESRWTAACALGAV
jgi:hypothetical protein